MKHKVLLLFIDSLGTAAGAATSVVIYLDKIIQNVVNTGFVCLNTIIAVYVSAWAKEYFKKRFEKKRERENEREQEE